MVVRSLSVRCRKGLARDVFVLQPHTASLLETLPVHVILRTDGPFGHAGRTNKIQWPHWFCFNSYPSFIEGIQNDKKSITTTTTTMTTKQNHSCHTLHQLKCFSRTKVALLLEVKVALLLEVLVVTETTINSSSVPNIPCLSPFLSDHLLYRRSSIVVKFRVLSKLVAVSSLCTLQTLHMCVLYY